MTGTRGTQARSLRAVGGAGTAVDAEYDRDIWDAHVLGIRARRGHNTARFDAITQSWLREPAKTWSRFRLATGSAFSTISTGAATLRRFSVFLSEVHPEVVGIPGIGRSLIEDYLSWLASSGIATNTRAQAATFLKIFLDWGRRYGTLPGLRGDAVLYEEDVARPPDALPAFIPEFVMAQIESETNLAALPSLSVRNLVVLLIETGMRGGDASELAFNPIVADSVGWPCLRFANSKVSAEQLIPLSEKAAAAIHDQQAHVTRTWPGGSPWLFPGILDNPEGIRPYAHASLSGQLHRWVLKIGLHDDAGRPVRIHAHQFRHTFATRLINAGVPQHVIQKLLGQASPRMTARYAQLFDQTVRTAFEAYCSGRVNVDGDHVPYDPDALTADAEWVKHNLARIADSLPNGYCGRPPQQDCPHPNACLTCPDFQTTPEFLDIHRRQADSNRSLLARAEANGQVRLAENLRRVRDSLGRIIPALERIDNGGDE